MHMAYIRTPSILHSFKIDVGIGVWQIPSKTKSWIVDPSLYIRVLAYMLQQYNNLSVSCKFPSHHLCLATVSDPSPVQDLCVANPSSSVRINGLPCMDLKLVNANHFFSNGINLPTNTSNPLGSGVTIPQIPAQNTFGLTLTREDFAPRGVSPSHTHPRATKIATAIEGPMFVGFVTSNPENKLISMITF